MRPALGIRGFEVRNDRDSFGFDRVVNASDASLRLTPARASAALCSRLKLDIEIY